MTLLLLSLFLLSVFPFSNAAPLIGVDYGQLGNNLPSPKQSVQLIKSIKAKCVKIYDANHTILEALSNKNIQVSIMVPNPLVVNISSNQTLADQWVSTNVLPFIPQTKIRYLLVGNEVLSPWSSSDLQPHLVPALRKIHNSLRTHNIENIKVGSPLAMGILNQTAQSSSYFPPSNGTFRSNISESVMKPMLKFLKRTKSFFFLDVYPFFPWATNSKTIPLDYALFNSSITYIDPANSLVYTNLLDQMVDSVISAMDKLGFSNIPLFIAESGWPTAGFTGANIQNAATYNRNLVKRMNAAYGTPARPNISIPVLIFSLYNENEKPDPKFERHWGLFYPNGTAVYEIVLTDTPSVTNNMPNIWRVEVENMACSGGGKGECDEDERSSKLRVQAREWYMR